MIAGGVAKLALLVVMLGTAHSAWGGDIPTDSLDRPARKTVVNLGPSRYMPGNRSQIQLSCFYYPGFLVKKLDDPGLKGTRWVTVTSILPGHWPKCHPTHTLAEHFIAKDFWSFLGMKGDLLFLEAADLDGNGGISFRVVERKNGKKVFQDSALWNGPLDVALDAAGNVSARYLRVVGEGCSIPGEGAGCWSRFRKYDGLAAAVPKCTGYRQRGEKGGGEGGERVVLEDPSTPSAVAYPVLASFLPVPSIKAVPGPITCKPVP